MSEGRTELLLFQVGARIYAAQVHDIRRIGSADGDGTDGEIAATALGEPFQRARGIVVACEGGDRILAVDRVLGVREVAEGDLRPLPPLAAQCLASAAVTGLAMIDEAPTPLLDLSTLVGEVHRGGAAARNGGSHRA